MINRQNYFGVAVFVLFFSLFITAEESKAQSVEAARAHESIRAYRGPATCVRCHRTELQENFMSVHYQWTGPTPFVDNIPGTAGKQENGFNTYCGTVSTSLRVACSSCHVGNGGTPFPALTGPQYANIDCLTCHQEVYKRKPAPPFTTVTGVGPDNGVYTWTVPDEDADGSFQFQPDETKMPVSILEAARSVHKPTRESCLSCHAYAAGSNCGKRGDLSVETADAPRQFEVHMSPQGQNMSCQECHTTTNHRIMGRGLDIRPSDVSANLTCSTSGCHTDKPHENQRLDNHTARVACQTCHIPEFAKLSPEGTEVDRDWTNPWWAQGLFGGQGGWKPEEIRQANIIPTYKWYDQRSQVYVLGQTPFGVNENGEYQLGLPQGDVNSPGARIYPMKEHTSNSAMLDNDPAVDPEPMIPFSTSTYFFTGNFDEAVAEGMQQAGMTGNWKMVRVHTYQTINHGVEPHEYALQCNECHTSSRQTPTRINLQGDLGYAPKGPRSSICAQCHEPENENRSFKDLHDKHVGDKRIGCEWCHNFSRPERVSGRGDSREDDD